jgi:hypothetical protein
VVCSSYPKQKRQKMRQLVLESREVENVSSPGNSQLKSIRADMIKAPAVQATCKIEGIANIRG